MVGLHGRESAEACAQFANVRSKYLSVKLKSMVRKGGLEPPCLLGATPSRWCVCQFHHFRAHNEGRENPSSSRSRDVSSIAKTRAHPRCALVRSRVPQ